MALYPLSNYNDGTKKLHTKNTASETTVTTMQNAATAIGNGTALDVSGMGTAICHVSGTFVGTVTFEASLDNSIFGSIDVQKLSGGLISSSVTSEGFYKIPCNGIKYIRARVSSYTSGSITVKGYAEALSCSDNAVQLSGSKGQVKLITLTDNSEVAIGGFATITTVVPAGKKWTVLRFFYDMRSTTGTTAGTHKVVIGLNSANTPLLSSGDVAYNKWIQYRYGLFYDGNSGTKHTGTIPSDEVALQESPKGLTIHGTNNLVFVYGCKDVNIPQTYTRRVDVFVYEEDAI